MDSEQLLGGLEELKKQLENDSLPVEIAELLELSNQTLDEHLIRHTKTKIVFGKKNEQDRDFLGIIIANIQFLKILFIQLKSPKINYGLSCVLPLASCLSPKHLLYQIGVKFFHFHPDGSHLL